MPRPGLSSAMSQAMLARETGEEIVVLLTLSHTSWPTTIRRALRRTFMESRGNTFFAMHFAPTFPSQEEGQLPRWRVLVDAVDQTVLRDLRSVSQPKPDCLVEVIMASAPDTVQITTGAGYQVFGYSFDLYAVTLDVSMHNLEGEGFPGGRIMPSNFPGGF